ncbi:CAMK family protein kinase [Tritrichomonas foetus]|uniref:CAMK family protein kinase n=1 Tax=Tritrichomonas foetus TaxID=1144522 RepID=A0A1J4JJW8_9EUKA|nr:CAMK family protein kinase [Tritrichomonas foetus]|eukprot:OHS98905.1 CAMK family protein kinase [Tritrichomonas foetus]
MTIARFEQQYPKTPFSIGHYQFLEKIEGCDQSSAWYNIHDTKCNSDFTACLIDLEAPQWSKKHNIIEEYLTQTSKVTNYTVRIYNYFTKNKILFIIIQKTYDTLANLLRTNGPLKILPLVSLSTKIIDVMCECHQQEIPIKHFRPVNILFDEYKNPMLSNIGLHYQLSPQFPKDLSLKGILPFQAPEVLLGECQDDFKADIWSFAVTLFAMATGRVPWSSKTDQEMKNEIINFDPAHPSFQMPQIIDPDLQKLIFVMLNNSPEKRPSFEDLQAEPYFRQFESKKISKAGSSTRIQSISTLRNLKEIEQREEAAPKDDHSMANLHSVTMTPSFNGSITAKRQQQKKKIHASSGHYK